MTTSIQHSPVVTARIDTGIPAAESPATGTSAVYTVTVYMNLALHSFFGYESGHRVAEVTTADGAPLRLTFSAATHADAAEAAEAAFEVGNRQGSDDSGQSWPEDVRSVSVGDVLAVTGPDGTTVHLSVDSVAFSEIDPPRTTVPLEGTSATSSDR
ncbi:hypothetical protein [Streptomyces sp. 7N604]|uniref:hypothetical protein n=1 Tax=Streptomyces sp. 7N604 TaxID=3457415 RepID=UPI003FD0DC69